MKTTLLKQLILKAKKRQFSFVFWIVIRSNFLQVLAPDKVHVVNYLDHFSDVFLLLFLVGCVDIVDVRGIGHGGGRVVSIILDYRTYFILLDDRVIQRRIPSPPTERRFAPSGATGTVRRLTTLSAGSYSRLEHQEIRFWDFEGVETSLEAVSLPQTI